MQEKHAVIPNGLWKLAINSLIITGASSSAIPEMDLREIRVLSPQTVIREGLLQSSTNSS